jgi:hypothetical protein
VIKYFFQIDTKISGVPSICTHVFLFFKLNLTYTVFQELFDTKISGILAI